MAFPTSDLTLAADLERAQRTATLVRRVSVQDRDRMAAGAITAFAAINLMDNLKRGREELHSAASRTGIAAYAQEQLGMDVSGDFTAMLNALDAAISGIASALPKDSNGYLLVETIHASGDRTPRTFSPAQTASIRGLLDTLIATIEG